MCVCANAYNAHWPRQTLLRATPFSDRFRLAIFAAGDDDDIPTAAAASLVIFLLPATLLLWLCRSSGVDSSGGRKSKCRKIGRAKRKQKMNHLWRRCAFAATAVASATLSKPFCFCQENRGATSFPSRGESPERIFLALSPVWKTLMYYTDILLNC